MSAPAIYCLIQGRARRRRCGCEGAEKGRAREGGEGGRDASVDQSTP